MTKQFSNYSDLLTFTRASKGHALRPVSYGDELVVNGDFATDTSGWTANNSSLSAVSGKLRLTQQGSGLGFAQTTVSTVAGKLYRFEWDYIAGTSATPTARLGSASLASNISSVSADLNGINFVAVSSTTYVNFRMSGTTDGLYAEFDNVSVKEVTFDQPDGTLTLFEHPNNVPRVEWDADRNRLGLLVEESRTNLVTYSEDFSQWTGFSDPNEILAPDGTLTATKARDNNQGTSAAVQLNEPVTVSTSTTYTYSVFGKKGQLNWMALGVINFTTPSNARVWFDLDNGVVGTEGPALSGAIEEYPNGWYRCSVTFTTDAADTSGQLYIYLCEDDGQFTNTNRDGTSDLYVWGAQLEVGSFPTSYIKNQGTSGGVTRSADVASIPVADFGFNADAGALVAEYNPFSVSSTARGVFELSSGTGDDKLHSRASVDKHWLVRSGGVTQASIDLGSATEGQQNKISGAYKLNDFAASLNGSAVTTDTSGSVPSGIQELIIGSFFDGSNLNGHIKKLMYIPRRLTNAQLVDLTSQELNMTEEIIEEGPKTDFYLRLSAESDMPTVLSAFYRQDYVTQIDEETGESSQVADGDPYLVTHSHDYAISVVGTLHEPTGTMLTDEEGNEYPEMQAMAGWHINIRLVGDGVRETVEALDETHGVNPETPMRVWL